MGFNIFTNPLEMHRYFEQQMNEFMKQFQMEDHSFGSFDFPGNCQMAKQLDHIILLVLYLGFSEFPALKDPSQEESSSGSLRNRFLKSGYEKAIPADDKNSKVDSDVDGR